VGASQGYFNPFLARKGEKSCLREFSAARNEANAILEEFYSQK
jgi:hypothetical protein